MDLDQISLDSLLGGLMGKYSVDQKAVALVARLADAKGGRSVDAWAFQLVALVLVLAWSLAAQKADMKVDWTVCAMAAQKAASKVVVKVVQWVVMTALIKG